MAVFRETNVIRTFNVGLIVTMVVTFLLGVVTLYSATKGPGIESLYKSQLIYFGVGVVFGIVLLFIDVQMLEKLAYPSYAVCLVLLAAVDIFGKVGGGSQRWLPLGPVHLQPSEISKIAIVFTLAKYFANDKEGPPYTLKKLLVPGILVAPMFILILIQ